MHSLGELMTDDGQIQVLQEELNRSCGLYENAIRNFEIAFRQHEANDSVDREPFRLASWARVTAARQYMKALRAFELLSNRLGG